MTTEDWSPAPAPAPVRFAFVSDAVWPWNTGGKERRLWEITRRLAAEGHDVHIYTMKWWKGPRSIEADGVHLHAVMKKRPLYHGERRSMAQAVLFGLATCRLARADFDVVDVDHMPFFPLFAARAVATLRAKPMTATWHEVWGGEYWKSYLGRFGRLAALVERLAARMPDQIVAVSDQTADRLRTSLGVRRPVHVITNGVDFDAIDRAPASELTPDVLFAGRLLANKNVDLLVRAVAILAATRPGLAALVIGRGPDEAALVALAGELGLADVIAFGDFLPGDEIYGVMKSARVFVLPSVREGFGAVVLEANAAGLPVVTVEHPDNAARHLIVAGETGFVVALDPESIAAGISSVLDHRDTMKPRQAMDESGRWLDWQAVTDRMAAVQLSLIAPARADVVPAAALPVPAGDDSPPPPGIDGLKVPA